MRLFGTVENAKILDVVGLTRLRPDGHRADYQDCLHYYLPSVVDVWVQLMYNMLVGHVG